MASLTAKTLFITGASRGIGHAIGVRAARDGANVVIAAKTTEPHPKLPGTIYTAAKDMERAGGKALAVACDVRDEKQVTSALQRGVDAFGGIDILVNNAGAIRLTSTPETPMKAFDLLHQVNVRAAFLCAKSAYPYLKAAPNPHVLMIAPPLNLDPKWLGSHCAYTLSKYGMSLCALGMAEEFRPDHIGVNTLWPRTVIDTAAIALLPTVSREGCRTSEIMADAAHAILTRDSRECSGNSFIDEDVLAERGVTDFGKYAVKANQPLVPDLFVD